MNSGGIAGATVSVSPSQRVMMTGMRGPVDYVIGVTQDGEDIILTDHNSNIHLFNINTGALTWTIDTGRRAINVTVADNNEYIIATDLTCIHALRRTTGEVIWSVERTTEDHYSRTAFVSVSPDSKLVALSGSDGHVCVYDSVTGDERYDVKAFPDAHETRDIHNGHLFIEFSRDSRHIIAHSACSNSVYTWSIETGIVVGEIVLEPNTYTIRLTRDRECLVRRSTLHDITIHSLSDGRIVGVPLRCRSRCFIINSPDHRRVFITDHATGGIYRCSFETGQYVRLAQLSCDSDLPLRFVVAMTPDSQRCVACRGSNVIDAWSSQGYCISNEYDDATRTLEVVRDMVPVDEYGEPDRRCLPEMILRCFLVEDVRCRIYRALWW